MVAVSERAKRMLLEQRRAANIDGVDVGLRVAAAPSGQWMLLVDEPRDGDQVVEHEGTTVLLVDPVAQSALVGAEVDCMETADGDIELVLSRAHPEDEEDEADEDDEEEDQR